MESDFTDLLADFVRQAESDLDSRLDAQADALKDLTCTEPTLGKWVDAHDVEYMLAAFALNDDDFVEHFPSMAKITANDRNRIIKAFENHFEHCPHCHRKRSYDLEFNSRIEFVTRQNRAQLLHHLKETEPAEPLEEEHEVAAAGAAHH